MPTTRNFECGDRVLVTWQGSKYFNRYGVIVKIGRKKVTVRFTNETIGFVYFRHAKKLIQMKVTFSLPKSVSRIRKGGTKSMKTAGRLVSLRKSVSRIRKGVNSFIKQNKLEL